VRKRPVDSITTSTSSSAPGQLGRIGLGQHAHGAPVYFDPVVVQRDRCREAPEDGVVAQQVSQGARGDDVIHRHDFDAGVALVDGAQHAAADSAEAVDGYSDRH
jgi:hypothetical protein